MMRRIPWSTLGVLAANEVRLRMRRMSTLAAVLAYLLAVALLGTADGPQLAAVFAIRHRETPPRSLSQVFTTAASLKIGCAAVGGAVAAPLLQQSAELALLSAAAGQVAAMGLAIAAGTPLQPLRPIVPGPDKGQSSR